MLVIVSGFVFSDAFAYTISDDSTGGDCETIGIWDLASKTCTLSSDLAEGITIASSYITLDGNGFSITGANPQDESNWDSRQNEVFGIFVETRTNVIIKNIQTSNFYHGIFFNSVVNSQIQDITSKNNRNIQIHLSYSNDNTISDNTVPCGTGIAGIGTYFGNGNDILGNTITDCSNAGITVIKENNVIVSNNIVDGQGTSYDPGIGITVNQGSHYATITENTVKNYHDGLLYTSGEDGLVKNNIIFDNENTGLQVSWGGNIVTDNTISNNGLGISIGTNGNTVYHNNLISNNKEGQGGNMVNLIQSSELGGNYWSDYSNVCTDSNNDNFCDEPYPLKDVVNINDDHIWTVQDGWLTTISTPDDITLDAADSSGTSYDYSVSATHDASSMSVTCDMSSGSVFPIGTTEVVCTTNNGIKSTFSVTVNPLPPIINPSSPCDDGCTHEGNNLDLKIFASGNIENPVDGISTISSVWKDPTGIVVYDKILQVNSQGQFNNEFDNPMYVRDMRDSGLYTTTYQYDDVTLEYTWNYLSSVYVPEPTPAPITINLILGKQSYSFEDSFVNISGDVSNPETYPNLEFRIINSQGGVIDRIDVSSDNDGSFSLNFPISQSNLWNITGDFIVTLRSSGELLSEEIFFFDSTPISEPPTPDPEPTPEPTPESYSITVRTSSSSYDIRDNITISGKISPEDRNALVILDIFSDNGNQVFRDDLNTDDENYSFTIDDDRTFGSEGDYVVKVSYVTATAETEFEIEDNGGYLPQVPDPIPDPDVIISVKTNRNSYHMGDELEITGIVRPSDGSSVMLQVYSASGNLVYDDKVKPSSSGAFTQEIKLTGKDYRDTGTYTVKAISQSASDKIQFILKTGIPDNTPKPQPTLDDEVTIVPASDSGAPGCEETPSGCFHPQTQSVAFGGKVIMTNTDSAAHTFTAGTPGDGPSGEFDTGLLMANSSFEWNANTYGTVPYFCMVHPWMEGLILVGEGTSIPTPDPKPDTRVDLDISTNSKAYDLGDIVNVDVEIEGVSNSQRVAVDVTDPRGNSVISRTLTFTSDSNDSIEFRISEDFKTGTYKVTATTLSDGKTIKDSTHFKIKSQFNSFTISNVDVTDQQGNPSNLEAGELGFIKVDLESNKLISTLVTVNIFDSELTSIGIGSVKTTLSSGDSEIILSFMIPDDAAHGTADVFVNAFSDWPSNGGIPLTNEFAIAESIGTSSSEPEPKCGAGTVYDYESNSCILGGGTTSTPPPSQNSKCGSGTVFDEVGQSCVLEGTQSTSNSIVVTTDKAAYTEGQTIVITGEVRDLYSGTPVSVITVAPSGDLVSIAQLSVGADKKFRTEIAAGGALMKNSGTYKITVQYGTENRSATTYFEFGGSIVTPPTPIDNTRITDTTVSVSGTNELIEYTITGGKLLSIVPDSDANSLIVLVDSPSSGILTLTIPRVILDATLHNGEDEDFFVVIDGEEVDFTEMKSSTDRKLFVGLKAGYEEIEIVGTYVIS